MRIVKVTNEDFAETAGADGTLMWVTGTDEDTGERVKFAGSQRFMLTLANLAETQGAVATLIETAQILLVTSNPEWDSPGTSPED
jgi:hypothetical protein